MPTVHVKIEDGILSVKTLPDDTTLVIDDVAINRRLVFKMWEGRKVRREEKIERR